MQNAKIFITTTALAVYVSFSLVSQFPITAAAQESAAPAVDAAVTEAKAENPAETVPETTSQPRVSPNKGYGSLAFPLVADRLALTDTQKIEVQKLLDERRRELAAVDVKDLAAQEKIVADSDAKLEALLTPEQVRLFPKTKEKGIRLIADKLPWSTVLNQFARETGKQLQMQAPPPGTFTYTTPGEVTPVQFLDLINSR
ncbi:MAG: hypothetical protein ACRC2T_04300, partial [Thermoguttaceae bacterium]